jgi:hypothetical protein
MEPNTARPTPSDEAAFWRLIAGARAAGSGYPEETAARLLEEMGGLEPDEIVRFDAVLQELMARTYTWDLWAAAYIVQGGCSDDCFEYFRGWLIAQGEDVFHAAVRDPGTLVDVADPFQTNECESIFDVARQVYQAKTGRELPWQRAQAAEPAGEPFDDATVNERFPNLAAAFSA